jgi:Na+-driven multidrug efflux pump
MKQTVVVFISLLIDLLAFTLILPLFPKIFDHYNSNTDVNTCHYSYICIYYLFIFFKLFNFKNKKGLCLSLSAEWS